MKIREKTMYNRKPGRTPLLCGAALILLIASAGTVGVLALQGPAEAEALPNQLPDAPANGIMGFVVQDFVPPVIQGNDACPVGTTPKMREAYLATLSPDERTRLERKENEPELTKRWQATVFGSNGTNICSQPDQFDRPVLQTLQSSHARGLDLDGDAPGESCSHQEFAAPDGRTGIDNQEYRVMGCTLEWRGKDGIGGDQLTGMRQFHASGEWTQVILLRGVDSLQHDDDVEVIYGNTPDRPQLDNHGNFLPDYSFTISDKAPRHRNVLRGRIDNGVLTTAAQDIKLTQTWGQGGARDIRGARTAYDLRGAKLRLTFQSDGSVRGLVGGYRPVFDVIQSPAIGGAGAALAAGIDCAGLLATLHKYADGIRDPKTGKCSGVSSAMDIYAVRAFVNDVPSLAARSPSR
ncbi:hypothetical protein [Novosphingobium sp. P6W]|uniref:hypothetical protein n=1 Tax=Novosphingobium sp. P6W TaxID=1609758 RepID=UPI000AB5A16B|nr:hypothetical protein [Novosphingobium sp. P6W]